MPKTWQKLHALGHKQFWSEVPFVFVAILYTMTENSQWKKYDIAN